MVQITPQVGGTVMAIMADDTDFVKAGQPLVQARPGRCPGRARAGRGAAGADGARGAHALRQQRHAGGAGHAARRPTSARAQSDVARAQDDLKRRQPLVGNGAVGRRKSSTTPDAQLANAKSALAAAQAGVAAAREQLASNQSLTEGTSVEQHPNVLRRRRQGARGLPRAAARRRCRRRSTATSPSARVQLGQRVAAGTPLMSIVPLDQVWVDANFKEVQLRNIRIGQPVDAHGRRVRQEGRVPRHGRRPGRRHRRGLRAAAGAERHRQLDQGGAARAGAHRARPEAAHGASAARRPVDGCRGRRRQRRAARCWPTRRAAGARRRRRSSTRSTPAPTPRCSASSPPTSAGRAASRATARAGAALPATAARRDPAPRRRRGVDAAQPAQSQRPRRRACRPPRNAPRRPVAAGDPREGSGPAAAAPAAPARAAEHPPLQGSQLVLRHDRAVARDLHERARHVDRQRVDPGDRRRPGRQPDAGHLGHHPLRGRQRDLGAAHRLADAALRPGAPVHRQRAAVRASRRGCAAWRRTSRR